MDFLGADRKLTSTEQAAIKSPILLNVTLYVMENIKELLLSPHLKHRLKTDGPILLEQCYQLLKQNTIMKSMGGGTAIEEGVVMMLKTLLEQFWREPDL